MTELKERSPILSLSCLMKQKVKENLVIKAKRGESWYYPSKDNTSSIAT